MGQDKAFRFITQNEVEVEHLPRGQHDWMCKPGLTDTDELILVRVHMPPGIGHPFHRHPTMEEIIYIVSGRGEQWIENESRELGPGDMAHIPRDVVHGLYNIGDEHLVFLAILTPARFDESGMIDVSGEEPWRSLKAPVGISESK